MEVSNEKLTWNPFCLISYDWAGYHAVFVLPLVLLVIDIALRYALIEKSGNYHFLSPSSGEAVAANVG
jgi:hypothetical protein